MRPSRLIPCLALGLLIAACGGMPPEQELKVLSPAETGAPAEPPADQAGGSGATAQGRAVALVELARGQVAWLQSLLEEVKARQARGEATATDVAQVESRLAAAKARRAALEGELAVSCARYREVVGKPAPGCPH